MPEPPAGPDATGPLVRCLVLASASGGVEHAPAASATGSEAVSETGSDVASATGPEAPPHPASDLAAVARFRLLCEVLEAQDPRTLLRRMVTLLASCSAPGTGLSVIVGHPDDPRELVTDSSYAQRADGVQLEAALGPSRLAYERGEAVLVEDLAGEPSWRPLAGLARRRDVALGSALAVPITHGDQALGVLTAYSPQPDAFDPAVQQVVTLAASAIGVRLADEHERAALEDLTAHLRTALISRPVIDEAKGMLMARFGWTAEQAFEHLRMLSSHTNVKLRVIAERLVAGQDPGFGDPAEPPRPPSAVG